MSAPDKLQVLSAIAEAIYESNDLAFHNVTHIKKMCRAAKYMQWANKTRMSNELRLAICYHDVVYFSHKSDNEAKSAELFRNIDKSISCIEDVDDSLYDVDEVVRLIGLTARHLDILDIKDFGTIPIHIQDSMTILDADLSGFSEPSFETYFGTTKALRAECPHLTDSEFYSRRKNFLVALLTKPSIYYSDYGRSVYEPRARANISRELELLY